MLDVATRLFQVLNLLILAGWLAAIFAALIGLRGRQLDDVARVLWVILIVVVPLLGALAFFIVQPGAAEGRDRAHEEIKGER
ncbi:MAG: PLDc N-terminal domain-containing protein [Chloroflexota bacterium]|nr:PLDc N-terminal domain-containing protein [Chloroflexota bacterium]